MTAAEAPRLTAVCVVLRPVRITTTEQEGVRCRSTMSRPRGAGQEGVAVLGREQARAAAAAVAAGHAAYPAFRHVFPDPGTRAKVLPIFFEATVRDAVPFGSVLAVTDGDRVDATAVWLPPGGFPWTPRRKLRATVAFARIMARAPRRFPSFMRYGANIEAAPRRATLVPRGAVGAPRVPAPGTRLAPGRADPGTGRPRRDAVPARDVRSGQHRVLRALRLRGHRPGLRRHPWRSAPDVHAATPSRAPRRVAEAGRSDQQLRIPGLHGRTCRWRATTPAPNCRTDHPNLPVGEPRMRQDDRGGVRGVVQPTGVSVGVRDAARRLYRSRAGHGGRRASRAPGTR
jgi:hypothetical protein